MNTEDAGGDVAIGRRIGRGLSWSLLGSLANSAFNLALGLIIARLLGREVFGEYGVVQSTAVALSGMAQLATGYTATRYVAETRTHDPQRTGRVIALCEIAAWATSAAAALINLAFAGSLAGAVLHAPQLGGELRLATGLVLFSTLNGYQIGVLSGLERYSVQMRLLGLTGAANFCLAIGGTLFWGLPGAMAGLSLGALVRWAAFHWALKTECLAEGIRPDLSGAMAEKDILFRFALPAAVSGLSSMPAFWIATAILARQANGLIEVAHFTAATTIRAAVLYLPLILNKVSMSVMNNQLRHKDSGNYRRAFMTNLRWTSISIVISSIVVGASGPWLLRAFGKGFNAGFPVLLPLLFSIACDGLTQAPYQVVQSREKMWLSFFVIILPRDAILIAASAVFCPTRGAVGLAWAYAAASLYGLASTSMIALSLGLGAEEGPLELAPS